MSAVWCILVSGFKSKKDTRVPVASSEDIFNQTTIKQLKQKIIEKTAAASDPDELRLIYGGKQLEDAKTIKDYKMGNQAIITMVVRMVGGSRSQNPTAELKYTQSIPDCIDSDNKGKRVLMKCGHAVGPDNLTDYCRFLLGNEVFEIRCPGTAYDSESGESRKCNKEWDYFEVRAATSLADDGLTDEEIKRFETEISENATVKFCDMKQCPSCDSFIERLDRNNLRVTCGICTKEKGYIFDFCWNCKEEWTRPPTTAADKCGNPDCVHPDLKTILEAKISIICGQQVCSIRACPTCGMLVEHTGDKCKMIYCLRCNNDYCFLCLKSRKECLTKRRAWFGECAVAVAPRQTAIPIWSDATN